MKDITIGGQAVIEGVMMKSKEGWAVAVRNPEGEIVIKSEKLKKTKYVSKNSFSARFFLFLLKRYGLA